MEGVGSMTAVHMGLRWCHEVAAALVAWLGVMEHAG
jgi:hypothetical protein